MPEYFNTTSTLFGQPPESATDHEATLAPAPERYYVDEREEGWAVFDRQTGAPVSHPVIHKPYVDLKCERMNQARREILAPTTAPAGDDAQEDSNG